MVKPPYQTLENLADDIFFFSLLDLELCSLGPYIPHSDTPFGGVEYLPEETLNLGLNMISVVRVAMPDVNIASSSSLDNLSDDGEELGLTAGANIVLPQLSTFSGKNKNILSGNKPKGVMEYRALLKELEGKIKLLDLVADTSESADSSIYMQSTNSTTGR